MRFLGYCALVILINSLISQGLRASEAVLPSSLPITCEAIHAVEGNFVKVAVSNDSKGYSLVLSEVNAVWANQTSQDSWDIWSDARSMELKVEFASWGGNSFPTFEIHAHSESGISRSVILRADPAAAIPNATLELNGTAVTAHCR